jgi:F-type H+-transporting ATPase subunit gamma
MDVSYHILPLILASLLHFVRREADACTQNASKNAGDMINRYQILFNRTRQAVITGELVEIITGAAASEA